MDQLKKFEIHYYLPIGVHSVDALMRNKCEADFLAIFFEALEILDLDVSLEAEALAEGGVREIWKALGDNNNQITLVLAVLAIVLTQVPNTDEEMADLKKEETRLSIEEKKLTIEKLKEDLNKQELPPEESVKSAARVVDESYKTRVRKSNFYKELLKNPTISEVGFTSLDSKGKPATEEKKVKRDSFINFIFGSNQLAPIKNDNALIEVVAPVLNEGKAKWKGIYEEAFISFDMNDGDFKRAVLAKEISFKNGTLLICTLRINKRIDESGEIVISGYTVETVLDKIDGGVSVETPQGKAYRHTTKLRDNQSDMFNDKDA
jgi:hypothetical protein